MQCMLALACTLLHLVSHSLGVCVGLCQGCVKARERVSENMGDKGKDTQGKKLLFSVSTKDALGSTWTKYPLS